MSARAHLQLLLTAEAILTYVVWSEQEVWLIVLMYTEVMKHRAAPWVARSHQPLNSHNSLDRHFCHLPFLSPFQPSTKLTPSSNYLFLIGHHFAAPKIEHFYVISAFHTITDMSCWPCRILLSMSPALPFNSL